ncbi:hypothetical protein [Leptospira sarikeiensis]|uniref:Uncharacterized protein n=1 Tax=Leptospira sarikeiensis TaxID=2484943 RepID=A0A4R9KDA2_9LEPT|nr:hypothetical protein [Leptospira sarikeiensis]TGL65953.1 hypothetical protein EHQ64_00060 [Leptospira sarikeiensis]
MRIDKPAILIRNPNSTNSINFQKLDISVFYEELEKLIPENQKDELRKEYSSIIGEVSNNLKSKLIQDSKKNDKIQIKLSYQSEGKLFLGLINIQPELKGYRVEIINTLSLGLIPSWLSLNLCATVMVDESSDVICGKKLQVFHLPRALGMLSFFILIPLDVLFAVTVFPYEKRTPLTQQLLYYDSDFPGWIASDSNSPNYLSTSHKDLLYEISNEISKSILKLQSESSL